VRSESCGGLREIYEKVITSFITPFSISITLKNTAKLPKVL
jgi:hypothetical protein